MAWALSRSKVVSDLIAAPGNPGIGQLASCTDVSATDPEALLELAGHIKAELVVIGPEAPLIAGVGDDLRQAGLKVFGPSARAARLEGSKSWAKEVMARAGVPSARARTFAEVEPAIAFMDELGPPYVVKADGVAAGKGVVVTEQRDKAIDAIEERVVRRAFGEAGTKIIIESYLVGQEVSLIAFTDGRVVIPCDPAQDYKRALDGDRGPNTGGMGSYSPVPSCPGDLAAAAATEIIEPVVRSLADDGIVYAGAIYAGLILNDEGTQVLEFNARLGDPETQALLPRLAGDFGELCLACADGDLAGMEPAWREEACVDVVIASAGYPGPSAGGVVIEGVGDAAAVPGVEVFHAGTAVDDGELVTSGGRVLSVSALGPSFEGARALAYEAAGCIHFEGSYMRSDIGLQPSEDESLLRSRRAHPALGATEAAEPDPQQRRTVMRES